MFTTPGTWPFCEFGRTPHIDDLRTLPCLDQGINVIHRHLLDLLLLAGIVRDQDKARDRFVPDTSQPNKRLVEGLIGQTFLGIGSGFVVVTIFY
jgi:hypothetical protein